MASRDWELAGAACEASSCEWDFAVRKLSAMAERLRPDLMRLVYFIVFIWKISVFLLLMGLIIIMEGGQSSDNETHYQINSYRILIFKGSDEGHW